MGKTFSVLAAFVFIVSLPGCGGSGGGSIGKNPPSIAGLYLTPASAKVGDGSGSITLRGDYTFSDPDKNITTAFIDWSDTTGGSGTLSGDAGLGGYASGSAWFQITAGTSVASTTTFTFYVTDSTGLQSNELGGTWTVSP